MVNQYNDKIKQYLKWMLEMTQNIQEYIWNVDYEQFANNKMMIDAVITPITQIWELSSQIKKLEYEKFEIDLPIKEMSSMRNFLVHSYHKIDKRILRDTITENIPKLQEKLVNIISSNKF